MAPVTQGSSSKSIVVSAAFGLTVAAIFAGLTRRRGLIVKLEAVSQRLQQRADLGVSHGRGTRHAGATEQVPAALTPGHANDRAREVRREIFGLVGGYFAKVLGFGFLGGSAHYLVTSLQEQLRLDALERLEEQREALHLMDLNSMMNVKPIPLEEMGDSEGDIQSLNQDLMRQLEARDIARAEERRRNPLRTMVGDFFRW